MIGLTQKIFFSAAVRVVMLALFLVTLGACIARSQTNVDVPNFGYNTLAVIDITTIPIVATTPVGNRPLLVAVTPNAPFVYVTRLLDSSLAVIDTATNTIIATIPV